MIVVICGVSGAGKTTVGQMLSADRLASREDHFLDRELLGSQLEALEIPEYGQQIDIQRSTQDIVNVILRRVCAPKGAPGNSQN